MSTEGSTCDVSDLDLSFRDQRSCIVRHDPREVNLVCNYLNRGRVWRVRNTGSEDVPRVREVAEPNLILRSVANAVEKTGLDSSLLRCRKQQIIDTFTLDSRVVTSSAIVDLDVIAEHVGTVCLCHRFNINSDNEFPCFCVSDRSVFWLASYVGKHNQV